MIHPVTEASLTAFALDERIDTVAATILPLCVDSGIFEGLEPLQQKAKAKVIATFACCCAPIDASSEGILLAARLTAIFFFLDDTAKSYQERCVEQMLDLLHSGVAPPSLLPQVRAFADYLADIGRYGDTTAFRRQFDGFLLALLEEAQLLSRGPLSTTAYNDIRHRIIFVEEYLWSWILSENKFVDATLLEQTARLRRLASEVVYLVNDLGSVERERAAGCRDPNLVFIVEREHGLTPKAAIDNVIQVHNETASTYKQELARVKDARGATAKVGPLADLIDCVVTGNLVTTKRLCQSRYPGSYDALLQLRV